MRPAAVYVNQQILRVLSFFVFVDLFDLWFQTIMMIPWQGLLAPSITQNIKK